MDESKPSSWRPMPLRCELGTYWHLPSRLPGLLVLAVAALVAGCLLKVSGAFLVVLVAGMLLWRWRSRARAGRMLGGRISKLLWRCLRFLFGMIRSGRVPTRDEFQAMIDAEGELMSPREFFLLSLRAQQDASSFVWLALPLAIWKLTRGEALLAFALLLWAGLLHALGRHSLLQPPGWNDKHEAPPLPDLNGSNLSSPASTP